MSVRVVARIRPLLPKEEETDVIVTAGCNTKGRPIVKIPSPKNGAEEFSFAFNSVYDHTCTQEELFNAEVLPHMQALFQGIDVTFFAYGVTGTGKTHTMRGGLSLSDRGLIPRLLSNVFLRARKMRKIARTPSKSAARGSHGVDVHLSYYEIYNDKVFDLLEPVEKRTPNGLPLREKDGKTCVVGLTERACEQIQDFEKLYIEANTNRVTAATKLNAHSSRSHAILRVKITQYLGDHIKESVASAIDLAGSEDNRRTDNSKQRLVESAAINKSLFVLSQCIDAIGRGDKRIPYRESKMTRILSLGQNNGITVMVLNLAPIRSYHLDTLSSLSVSSRAKRIEVREIENEVVYKTQPPKSTVASAPQADNRQPLRSISNSHNSLAGVTAAKEKDGKAEKPVKMFHVYSDKTFKPQSRSISLPAVTAAANTGARRVPLQRTMYADKVSDSRLKTSRPRVTTAISAQSITPADIEAMVEKKVAEILASRAADEHPHDQPRTPSRVIEESTPHTAAQVPYAIQRRLEALEKRIEAHEKPGDERSKGLRLLVQARRSKEAGDEEEALRHYEAALPYFPDEKRVLNKIVKLRARIAARAASRELNEALGGADEIAATTVDGSPTPKLLLRSSSVHMFPRHSGLRLTPRAAPKRKATLMREDGKSETCDPDDADYEDDERHEPASVKKQREKHGSKVVLSASNKHKKSRSTDSGDELAPASDSGVQVERKLLIKPVDPQCVAKLLDIVNTRNESRLLELPGLGPKKARGVVEYLNKLGPDKHLESISQLRLVPGMGERTIEKALELISC